MSENLTNAMKVLTGQAVSWTIDRIMQNTQICMADSILIKFLSIANITICFRMIISI